MRVTEMLTLLSTKLGDGVQTTKIIQDFIKEQGFEQSIICNIETWKDRQELYKRILSRSDQSEKPINNTYIETSRETKDQIDVLSRLLLSLKNGVGFVEPLEETVKNKLKILVERL